MIFVWLGLNTAMAILTITIAFPGMLPPKDGAEWFMATILLVLMSFGWPLYLALAPIAFLVLYILGDWKPSDHAEEWPWSLLRRHQR